MSRFPRKPPVHIRMIGHLFDRTRGGELRWIALPEIARGLAIPEEAMAQAVELARAKGWVAVDDARPRRVCLTDEGRALASSD